MRMGRSAAPRTPRASPNRPCSTRKSTIPSRHPIRLPAPSQSARSRLRRSRANRIDVKALRAHLPRMEARMGRKKDKPLPGDLTEEEGDGELEEGLEDTSPASDPPAATQPVHRQPDKKPE